MLWCLVVALSLPGATCGTRPASQPERRIELPNVDTFRRQHLQHLHRTRETSEEYVEWLELVLQRDTDLLTPELTRQVQETLMRIRTHVEELKKAEQELAAELGVRIRPVAPMPHEKK